MAKFLCSICEERIGRENEQVCSLPCGHVYHTECVKNWCKNRKACPICARRIRPHCDFRKLYFNEEFVKLETLEPIVIDSDEDDESNSLAEIETLKDELAKSREKNESFQKHIDEMDESIHRLKQQISDSEVGNRDALKSNHNLADKLRITERKMEKSKQIQEDLLKTMLELRKSKIQLNQKNAELKTQISQIRLELDQANANVAEHEMGASRNKEEYAQELKALQQELYVFKEREERCAEYYKEPIKYNQDLAELKQLLTNYEANAIENNPELDYWKNESEKLRGENTNLKEQTKRSMMDAAQIRARNVKLKLQQSQNLEELATCKAELSQKNVDLERFDAKSKDLTWIILSAKDQHRLDVEALQRKLDIVQRSLEEEAELNCAKNYHDQVKHKQGLRERLATLKEGQKQKDLAFTPNQPATTENATVKVPIARNLDENTEPFASHKWDSKQPKRSSLPPIRVIPRKFGTNAQKRLYPATQNTKSDGEISSDDEPSQITNYTVQTPKQLSATRCESLRPYATRNGRLDGKFRLDVALKSIARS
ncbi:ring finger domain-containing protein [Ditylenchus destructor]|nr:ring finger domain-containing protein [Ditylenchus destructor]